MTLVINLEGSANPPLMFHLFPITKIAMPPPKRRVKKCKLPYVGIAGIIISARYESWVRGIIRSTKKRAFRHAVTIDVSTSIKNVSVKLFDKSIQMCGAISEENGREAAQIVIDHIYTVESNLTYIRDNPRKTEAAIEWLGQQLLGEAVARTYISELRRGNIILRIIRYENDNAIQEEIERIPEYIDARIAEFFLAYVGDFIYYSDFMKKIAWIVSISGETIKTPCLQIQRINVITVNYNYSLGFYVNRENLQRCIDGNDGFFARYDNAIENYVTVEQLYVPINPNVGKKKDKPHHTFLIYYSGIVTQSGPGGDLMRLAYYRFWRAILPYIDKISM